MTAPFLCPSLFFPALLIAWMMPCGFGWTQESEPVKPEGYPDGIREIRYRSSADDSQQPALFWAPEVEEGKTVPLLVALHTWSGDYRQAGGEVKYAEWCQDQGWIFLHPNFRGRNRTEEAMGSDLAVEDIRAAVEWARENAAVDLSRIYAIGVSGGGHITQLLAGRTPEIWAGISSWCGISDIAAWHGETSASGRDRYAQEIETALGGAPDESEELIAAAWHRSPLKWLSQAASVPLDINHGIDDGRTGSVPFTHSLHAWNAIVPDGQRLSDDEIDAFYQSRTPPETGKVSSQESDPLYGDRPPVFQKTHANTRLTIFQGGHEIVHEAALNWLAAQRKGQSANWQPPRVGSLEVSETDKQSGK